MNDLFYAAIALLFAGGIAAKIAEKRPRAASCIGSVTAAAAMAGALVCGIYGVWTPPSGPGLVSRLADGSFFQIPIALTGFAGALFAPGYLQGHGKERSGFFWLFFNWTLAAMLGITKAEAAFEFLICWELMGLFSFLLVAFENRSQSVMQATWIYLLSCEAGGLLLMALFAFGAAISPIAQLILLLCGFGLKAGFPLFHVWLPEAHPAAPAPVSAVMSGAMIMLGFLGIFRFMPIMGKCPLLCGWILLVCGCIGAFSGILSGAIRKDLKRLLACSSVENTGIIAMGFGLGLLGSVHGNILMEYAGFTGAALHILNHALLKGTLFLGAGSVLKSAHTLNMDELGGLMKVLPQTGKCFTLSALGICGLPPFCGFTGELLIYLAAFSGIAGSTGVLRGASFLAAVILALTGAVACAAFAKAVSAVFLGLGRSARALEAEPEKRSMTTALWLLVIPSLLLPFCAGAGAYILFPAGEKAEIVTDVLMGNGFFTLFFYLLFALLWIWRKGCKNESRTPGTWDCGYALPSSRMEYTGSAFTQNLADLFAALLFWKKEVRKPVGCFPVASSIETRSGDWGRRLFWEPLFSGFAALAEKVHKFQSGSLHLYILVMVIALTVLLAWGFFSGTGVR